MLSAARFNIMLNKMGQTVGWRRAHDCPCRDPHSGAANYACPVCKGKGVFWEGAVEGKVAVAGQKVQHNWAKMGEYQSGDQVLSLPSDSPVYVLGESDRLTMLQSSEPFSQVFTHDGAEQLTFKVESIARCFWLDASGAVVDGGGPAVAADGTLTWASGEPPAGLQYTLTGRQRPEYFIYREIPQDRAHYGGQQFPRRVVARRMDLFGR